MSPTLSRSSALQRVKFSDALEIRNGIIFDFYSGLPHIVLFPRSSPQHYTTLYVKYTMYNPITVASFPGHSKILSQLSPQLRDKIWEWSGNEARQNVITFCVAEVRKDL